MSTPFTRSLREFIFCFWMISILFHPQFAYAQKKETITIDIGTKSIILSSENAAAGVSLAVADLGTDHIPELIIGNGLGAEPRVHVYRQNGTEVGSFLAYDKTMTRGINVVVCDVNGDEINEIIVAPQRGGGPHLRIFSNKGVAIDDGGIFAYNKSFREGINLACGDLDEDGISEIITMPGAGSDSMIKIWNLHDSTIEHKQDFFSDDTSTKNGFVGVVHDGQLSIAESQTKNPNVRTYVIHSPPKLISEKKISLKHDGVASLFIHNHHLFLSTTSDAMIIDTETKINRVFKKTIGSVIAIESDLLNDGTKQLVIAPSNPTFIDTKDDQTIIVNTSTQRLFAYEKGILEETFLVSTSLEKNATPIGIHHILDKIPKVHYAWSYGKNDPRNYDLGWVPYNLRFAPHIYLHYAPWHNNFGYRMTHGCVNIALEHMEWLYGWANVHTVVDVIK